jgi:putative membrane protein
VKSRPSAGRSVRDGRSIIERDRFESSSQHSSLRERAHALLRGEHMDDSSHASVNTELAARRTGMAFQRTRLSADRTLMSVIRTALSLITFGFTLSRTFRYFVNARIFEHDPVPNRFGEVLVLLGVLILVLGIGYHIAFMVELRRQRSRMKLEDLIHGESAYPISLVLIVAVLLLAIGILAFLSTMFHLGPFSD